MASVQQRLADSLSVLKTFQNKDGLAIVKASDISRTHLSRLVQNGFLQEVMKGWYIFSRPDASAGDTINWYTSYWYFIKEYSTHRFKEQWSLTPEQSLLLHSGSNLVPTQIIIRSPKGNNNFVNLLHKTSLLDLKSPIADPIFKEPNFDLNIYTLPEALVECSPEFFKTDAVAARICLSLIDDAKEILKYLLKKGYSVRAGRLVGAFRNIGNNNIADEILLTMKSFGYIVSEEDPFSNHSALPYTFFSSPYVGRLRLMWSNMREKVIDNFPLKEKKIEDIETCLNNIDASYQQDAYHSLSIEGYRVTEKLIEKVRLGFWNPEEDAYDNLQRNAMAARGYWLCFNEVKKSIKKILSGDSPAEVVSQDHSQWYKELFSPSLHLGLLNSYDLIGYRTSQVYIKGSMHIPLNPNALREAMPEFFNLLKNEPDARVRAVLGHFFFVYIHPYMDGNGRIARFLMNTMLISGGYSWTVIPVERRQEYMIALEKASVEQDIIPFTKFLLSLIK
ncbi:MAG: Fic family protein [Bacteroidales bacterium]|jgi:hypothetical protein|nr:Fic family protein [Bacteroidales bacterium]